MTVHGLKAGWVVLLAGALLLCPCVKRAPSGGTAVKVYVAAKVRTLDPAKPFAEAIALSGSRIAAVGTRAELASKYPDAEVIDLGKAVIVPGLIDAHGHLFSLGTALLTANLWGATSSTEVIERVKRAPETSYQGGWLIGRGWNQNDWASEGHAFPGREALDAAFPTTPVRLVRVDGHAVWVNGEALRRGGITAATKDPEGGRILRDAHGEPTGVLVDNAIDLLKGVFPEPTDEEREERLAAAFRRCAELGLTDVHDAGMDLATFTLLQHLDMTGRLPLRVYAMANGWEEDRQTFLERGPFQGRLLTMKSVKLLADGALGSRGAALHHGYSDEASTTGLLLLGPDELERRVRAFTERGFQVNVHAIGDRANTLVLDVFSRLSPEERQRLRPRIEHAQILTQADLPRVGQLGVIASVQPTHATSDMPWAKERLGDERLKGAYAWRSLLDGGARLALGSDFPIEDPNPLWGIYSARTRQDPDGKPEGGWYPEQRLTGEEALAGFTTGAAYAEFAEDRRGILKEGMDADFTALDVDPVDGEAKAVRNGKVLRTVVAGREVYAR